MKQVQFGFRTTKPLADKIRASAKASGRSISAEMVHRLERTPDQAWTEALHRRIEKLEGVLAKMGITVDG
tara:strand:+ start:576 stop:785 length:210 start_codon:yes stop_codon:yes gene_type:complete